MAEESKCALQVDPCKLEDLPIFFLYVLRQGRKLYTIYTSVAAAILLQGVGDDERWKVSRWKAGGTVSYTHLTLPTNREV